MRHMEAIRWVKIRHWGWEIGTYGDHQTGGNEKTRLELMRNMEGIRWWGNETVWQRKAKHWRQKWDWVSTGENKTTKPKRRRETRQSVSGVMWKTRLQRSKKKKTAGIQKEKWDCSNLKGVTRLGEGTVRLSTEGNRTMSQQVGEQYIKNDV